MEGEGPSVLHHLLGEDVKKRFEGSPFLNCGWGDICENLNFMAIYVEIVPVTRSLHDFLLHPVEIGFHHNVP